MGPMTSEETTELSVTQQEDTTLPVSLHDSDAQLWKSYLLQQIQRA